MIISDAAPGEGLVLMWWGKSDSWFEYLGLTYLPPPHPPYSDISESYFKQF